MAKITSNTFPTIEMVAARASELGMSYGTYSSSQQYTADKCSGYFETTYTRSGRRRKKNDRQADTCADDTGTE
ncbi:MAG: hypothetical protein ACI4RH_04625 [Huintestinicola sp.]